MEISLRLDDIPKEERGKAKLYKEIKGSIQSHIWSLQMLQDMGGSEREVVEMVERIEEVVEEIGRGLLKQELIYSRDCVASGLYKEQSERGYQQLVFPLGYGETRQGYVDSRVEGLKLDKKAVKELEGSLYGGYMPERVIEDTREDFTGLLEMSRQQIGLEKALGSYLMGEGVEIEGHHLFEIVEIVEDNLQFLTLYAEEKIFEEKQEELEREREKKVEAPREELEKPEETSKSEEREILARGILGYMGKKETELEEGVSERIEDVLDYLQGEESEDLEEYLEMEMGGVYKGLAPEIEIYLQREVEKRYSEINTMIWSTYQGNYIKESREEAFRLSAEVRAQEQEIKKVERACRRSEDRLESSRLREEDLEGRLKELEAERIEYQRLDSEEEASSQRSYEECLEEERKNLAGIERELQQERGKLCSYEQRIQNLEGRLEVYSGIEDDLMSLQQENTNIKADIAELELVEDEPEDRHAERVKRLSDKRVLLIGGIGSGLAERLREDIPNLKHIDVGETGANFRASNQHDIIVIYTRVVSHSHVNRVKKEVGSSTPIVGINVINNRLIVKEIDRIMHGSVD